MIRAVLTAGLWAALAAPPAAAAPAPSVTYRVDVAASGIAVEMRLRGEADGDTRLTVPATLAADLAVRGAQVQVVSPSERLLRHRPGASLRVRYSVPAGGRAVSALGESVFAAPQGWDSAAAGVRWGRLPKDWRMVSDLDHVRDGRPLTMADLRRSFLLAAPDLQTAERSITGGRVRAVVHGDDRMGAEKLAEVAATAVAAQRAYLGEAGGPFLVARSPAADRGLDRDDGHIGPQAAMTDTALRQAIVEAHMEGQVERLGRAPARPAAWLTGGFGQFLADRALLRAGLMGLDEAVGRLDERARAGDAAARGAVLALKWDEAIRARTGGKADLDDVIVRMRAHNAQFAPGHGPDLTTGLVSAAWVTAALDLRPDITAYAETARTIPLPEELFGGCLLARVTVSPGFDAGFNAEASLATKRVTGVRRRGPAWNSGLRDGMRIDAARYQAGDMTRQVELTVRAANGKGRPRRIAYWPYGDNDVSSRRLQLDPDLAGPALAACARRMGGT